MVKVSIIVPVYNCEKVIERTIRSLQDQSLREIEIILINDGSKDNSLSICREIAKEDSRIIVINQENKGVSAARNTGIRFASGEYIGFVDADDWVSHEMYRNMYNRMKNDQSDVCICNYIEECTYSSNLENLEIEEKVLREKEKIIEKIILNLISGKDYNNRYNTIMGSVWRLLIKRDFLIGYDITFKIGIPLMEDTIFSLEVFSRSKVVSIDKGNYYHYVNTPNSAIRVYRKNKIDLLKCVFSCMENILKEQLELDENVQKRLDLRYVTMCLSSITNEIRWRNSSIIKKHRFITQICNDEKLTIALRRLNSSNLSLKDQISIYLLKYKLSSFIFLKYKLVNKK